MERPKGANPFPWIMLLILVISIVVFWILPNQREPAEIRLNNVETQKKPG